MTDYTNLIARLEAAEGPSRDLDAEIHLVDETPEQNDKGFYKRFGAWLGRDQWIASAMINDNTPHYTASLDAAVSLLPEGTQYCLGCLSDTRVPVRGVSRYHAWVGSQDTVYAPTPALAFCIAALRARQASDL